MYTDAAATTNRTAAAATRTEPHEPTGQRHSSGSPHTIAAETNNPLGLFATGAYGAPTPTGADTSAAAIVKGLFYGGGASQLVAQAIGSFSICAATLVVAFALMYAVKLTGTLRISRDGEIEGLDRIGDFRRARLRHPHLKAGSPALPEQHADRLVGTVTNP